MRSFAYCVASMWFTSSLCDVDSHIDLLSPMLPCSIQVDTVHNRAHSVKHVTIFAHNSSKNRDSDIWPANRPLHHTKRAILLISTWVIFTNGNVVFKFFSLLQLNEGKPVLFILENHPQPVLFKKFQFSGFKSLAIFLKKWRLFVKFTLEKRKLPIFYKFCCCQVAKIHPTKKEQLPRTFKWALSSVLRICP